MDDAENLYPFALIVEADAVIAQTGAKFKRRDIGQPLDVAVAAENVIGQGFKQTQGSLAVDAPHVGARLWRPLNSFRHPAQPRRR
jgi:hypothetical protein